MARAAWRFLLGVGAATAVTLGVAAIQVYSFAQRDETRPAGAAIVLGAAVFGERPSPVFRERINHAINLYRQGHVAKLIFTGGKGEGDRVTEAEAARRYALAQGVPPDVILVETTSTTTRENLRNGLAAAQAHGLDSFLIVSTPSHMKRAMAIADSLGMEAYASPTRSIQWISRWTKARAFWREVLVYLAYLVGVR